MSGTRTHDLSLRPNIKSAQCGPGLIRLQRTTTKAAVVADTPFNHDWNREMFRAAAESIPVPMVEVALHGDPKILLDRARRRAASGSVHEIKARFGVNPGRYYSGDYQPVLPADRVVTIDTTDLDAVEVPSIARAIRKKLKSEPAGERPPADGQRPQQPSVRTDSAQTAADPR